MTIVRLACLSLFILLASCSSEQNDPYPASERGKNILYAAFTERPKHLDPAQSYTEDEYTFTEQIYEPPLQYHYLKRPYTLIAATADTVPVPRYFDAKGKALTADAPTEDIARSVYEIRIRPGIRYQPHPAFAVDDAGKPLYIDNDRGKLRGIATIADFAHSGSRELVADDYIYEIKRLAHPRLHSPIFGMMAGRIVGLKELGAALQRAAQDQPEETWLDLDRFALEGVTRVDRFTLRITLAGKYPQFVYWLAMPFFAPVRTGLAGSAFSPPSAYMIASNADDLPCSLAPATTTSDPSGSASILAALMRLMFSAVRLMMRMARPPPR